MKFNVKAVQNAVTRNLSKATKKVQKISPELTFVIGATCVVIGMIETGKASTKLDTILEPTKEEIDKLKKAHEHPEEILPEGAVYKDSDYKKDLALTYFKCGMSLAKLYLPAVLITGFALYSLATSNKILKNRNAALSAAYATLDRSYKAYREHVIERFGPAMDKELRYNSKTVEVEETIVDEKGKEKKVKKNIEVVDDNLEFISEYAKFFDERAKEYTDDPEYNKSHILAVQQVANQMLKARGHVFLNEVYDELGLPLTKAGQIVGWVYDEENPIGDNHIDFGIFNTHRASNRDFVNGYEPVILLDFNVDGKIVDILA